MVTNPTVAEYLHARDYLGFGHEKAMEHVARGRGIALKSVERAICRWRKKEQDQK